MGGRVLGSRNTMTRNSEVELRMSNRIKAGLVAKSITNLLIKSSASSSSSTALAASLKRL